MKNFIWLNFVFSLSDVCLQSSLTFSTFYSISLSLSLSRSVYLSNKKRKYLFICAKFLWRFSSVFSISISIYCLWTLIKKVTTNILKKTRITRECDWETNKTNLSVKIGSIELPEAQLTLQSRKPLGLQTVILKRPKFARNISKCLSFKHDNSNWSSSQT